jgi:hypothetical protein
MIPSSYQGPDAPLIDPDIAAALAQQRQQLFAKQLQSTGAANVPQNIGQGIASFGPAIAHLLGSRLATQNAADGNAALSGTLGNQSIPPFPTIGTASPPIQTPYGSVSPVSAAPTSADPALDARPRQDRIDDAAADWSPYSITDRSGDVNAPWAKPFTQNPAAVIIHHTGEGGGVDGTINTFNQRGYPAQYIMDRDGSVVQTLPEGYAGRQIKNGWGEKGAGLTNANTIGIEVSALNDADVTPEQIGAAQAFVPWLQQKYGIDPSSVFGHGEVNPGHKEATEGLTIANLLRGGGIDAPLVASNN